ncbi:MAG TPA: Xaa-Pro peptidase family protein [Pantanalinema sp.]
MATRPTTPPQSRRLSALRRLFDAQDLDALLVTHLPNIRYLTGFTGTAAQLVVTRHACLLVVDFRYYRQAAREAPGCTPVQSHGAGFEDATVEAILLSGARRVGFESGHLTFWDHGRLEVRLGKAARLVPAGGQVEALRLVKDAHEIEALRTASRLTREALETVLAELRPDDTEASIAARLEARFRETSLEGAAFDTLVASGARSALIHARVSPRAVGKGEMLLIDCGASYHGYKADMSRTVMPGGKSRRFEAIEGAVREALEKVIAAIRPGAVLGELDAIARSALAEHGLGEAFVHGLGHGIGLEVHEEPWLVPGEQGVLAAGMAIAVEPGVYLEGWGGVRLEETILVTPKGCEVLTRGPRASGVTGVLSLD